MYQTGGQMPGGGFVGHRGIGQGHRQRPFRAEVPLGGCDDAVVQHLLRVVVAHPVQQQAACVSTQAMPPPSGAGITPSDTVWASSRSKASSRSRATSRATMRDGS